MSIYIDCSLPHTLTDVSLQIGDANADLRTPAKCTTVENIRAVYGQAVARELIAMECEEGWSEGTYDLSLSPYCLYGFLHILNFLLVALPLFSL